MASRGHRVGTNPGNPDAPRRKLQNITVFPLFVFLFTTRQDTVSRSYELHAPPANLFTRSKSISENCFLFYPSTLKTNTFHTKTPFFLNKSIYKMSIRKKKNTVNSQIRIALLYKRNQGPSFDRDLIFLTGSSECWLVTIKENPSWTLIWCTVFIFSIQSRRDNILRVQVAKRSSEQRYLFTSKCF